MTTDIVINIYMAQSALSNAPVTNVQNQISLGGLSATNFAGTQNGFLAQTGGSGGVLQFPLEAPKYIMTFSISQYQRQNLTTIGQFVDAGYPGIVLPLPQPLVDPLHVNWQEVELGTLPGIIFNGIQSTLQGTPTTGSQAGATAGAGILGGANAVGGIPVVGGVAQSGVNIAEAMMGVAPNQFMTMLMRGPEYKKHTFNWVLSPNNFNEANNIRAIIQAFQNAMSPNFLAGFGQVPVLWEFPKIFRIRIYPNSAFTMKFKPCICDNFVVNYMPGGRGAFYENTSGGDGANAPESVQIQATFIELEFWTEGNNSGTNDPDDVYGQTPPQSLSSILMPEGGTIQSLTDNLKNFFQSANQPQTPAGTTP